MPVRRPQKSWALWPGTPDLRPPPNNASSDCLLAAGRPCGYLQLAPRASRSEEPEHGGRGRIRTFVARKERQIYSLLVLATHPPVPTEVGRKSVSQKRLSAKRSIAGAQTQKGLVSKDTSPLEFTPRKRIRLTPSPKIWWSWRRDLNPRPSDYKSDALPAELRQRCSNSWIIADKAAELQGSCIGRSTWITNPVEKMPAGSKRPVR